MISVKYSCALLCGAVLWLVSCASHQQADLVGDWVQPIPGQSGEQGIRIAPDGKASSINMHTLLYEGWTREGDRLVLTGRSIGNHNRSGVKETCEIKKLTKDRLVLDVDGRTETYRRAR